MIQRDNDEPGWLIVGHGTRHAAGRAEFLQTAGLLATRTSAAVEPCFLELAEPTIAQAMQRLAARGVRRVLAVPLLLFSAGHAKDDIPTAVRAAASSTGLEVLGQTEALGSQASLMELSRRRFHEAVQGARLAPEIGTHLLLVGRGGSDATATNAMRDYTSALAGQLGVRGSCAFVALARPLLPEALQEFVRKQVECVVVQPHLLFEGEVLETIKSHVARFAAEHQSTKWIAARHLGSDPLLIEAILARIEEALAASSST